MTARRSLAWPLVRRALSRSIPFGPMLVIGALVTLLYGARLDEAYMNWVNGVQPQSVAVSSLMAPEDGARTVFRGRVEQIAPYMSTHVLRQIT